jgi:hypothetical protein
MRRHEAEPSERAESYWRLVSAPAIWAAHFMLCYGTAAIWCAKWASPGGPLGPARTAIALYTAAALVGITVTGWIGWQHHLFRGATLPHDFDSRGDRHRFLGFATFLLAGLSALATIYTALAAMLVDTCR